MRPSPGGGDMSPAAHSRSRKSSGADRSAAHTVPSSHVPTSFYLKSEEDLEMELSSGSTSQTTASASRQRDSTFGVQSLADTLEAAFGKDSSVGDKKAEPATRIPSKEREGMRRYSQSSPKASSRQSESSNSSSPVKKLKRKISNVAAPISLAAPNKASSPVPALTISSTPKSVSVRSLKLSDEESGLDEAASQVIMSSGEEEEEEGEEGGIQSGESSSFPQLVMPSIQMPTRRPFTDRGKAMGKLKVLVAGESGVGKTSLIRSIVQLCEDIVHVDPLSPTQSFSQSPPPSKTASRKRKISISGTTNITEVHASTRSYPPWWTDLEESRVRRRKGSSDTVLERNLCFIDTPGYGKSPSNLEEQNLVVDYVESLLYQNASLTSMEDSDLLSVIGGHGGIQIDVVLYLLSPTHDISKDIEFMQRLSALTNVIPVIAKSDTLSRSEIVAVKTSILARLQTTSIKPFLFGKPLEDALLAVQGLPIFAPPSTSSPSSSEPLGFSASSEYPFNIPTYPYAVSSTPGSDSETMDASLLMSPDYVQPLIPSELAVLVDQVFNPESIAWLRHSVAKKFLAWRNRSSLPADSFILHNLQQQSLKRGSVSSSSVGLHGAALNDSTASSIFSAASPSGVLVPRTTSPFYPSNYNSNLQSPFPASSPSLSHTPFEGEGPTEFSLARYNNIAHGEQRLAEVRLAKWATDLQRSVRNERERYEELQRTERAKWLLDRVREEVGEGNIVTSPKGTPRAEWAIVRHGSDKEAAGAGRWSRTEPLDSRDPLGLCDFSDEVRRKGLVLVKVLGGVSVIGAVMVAIVKACGVETGLPEGNVWSWFTSRAE